jgi:hypothetical protein
MISEQRTRDMITAEKRFCDVIEALYSSHGPDYLLPFVNSSYEDNSTRSLRVAVVGISSSTADRDIDVGGLDERYVRKRFDWWWQQAGGPVGPLDTYPFFKHALAEVERLTAKLEARSHLFERPPLGWGGHGIYGTNAVKVYTSEALRNPERTLPETIWGYAPTWYAELDVMAAHDCLPHVVVVFGDCIWDAVRSAFCDGRDEPPIASYSNLVVGDLEVPPHSSSLQGRAMRSTVKVGKAERNVLIVRLQHPCVRSKVKLDASWLLAHPDFQTLALQGVPAEPAQAPPPPPAKRPKHVPTQDFWDHLEHVVSGRVHVNAPLDVTREKPADIYFALLFNRKGRDMANSVEELEDHLRNLPADFPYKATPEADGVWKFVRLR